MNYVSILGTLTADVSLKYLPSGTPIGKFSIAYNESYKDPSGKYVQNTHFFNVTVFGRRAEIINQYFRKGSRILVQGSLVQDTWTAKDGSNRSSVSIKLENFDFIDKKEQSQQPQQQYQPAPSQQQFQPQQSQLPEVNVDDNNIPF